MNEEQLISIANSLVPAGKGILAADESTGTIARRLATVAVEATEPNRRAYRNLLLTTEGIEEFISGVILFDETIRQSSLDGLPFPEVLGQKGIIPGIKVDTRAWPLAGFPGELITEGLDGLRDRLAEYYELGARFAKWRAVITIGKGIPTRFCIEANMQALARYAALCQEADIVPITEPEVLMDGDHTIERCEEVTTTVLDSLFSQLLAHRVMLEGMLLKPNMVLPGKDCPQQKSVQQVAVATLRCLRRVVPAALPGVVFLSGGQPAELATAHLNAMNQMGAQPWEVGFSFARALQGLALNAWRGQEANVPAAQAAFYHRTKCSGAARYGRYTKEMEG